MGNNINKVTIQTKEFVEIEMEIKDIPFLKETKRKDRNGASVYDIPTGMKILTTSADGKGVRWSDITTLTVEDGCSLRKVVTTGGKEVTVSSNESVAVFDPVKGLKKVCPDDIKDCLVPTVLEKPAGTEGTFDLGWVLGFWLSDGNIDSNTLTLTKENDNLRATFLNKLGKIINNDKLNELARTYTEMHDALNNAGISGMSKKFHLNTKYLTSDIIHMLKDCYPANLDWSTINGSNRSCLYKKFPICVHNWNKEALLGLLCGLITGDGSISINRSKTKPQLIVNIATSSEKLRDDIIWLGSCLGFNMTYSITKATENRVQTHDSYTIPVSTPVLRRYIDKLFFAGIYDKELEMLKTVKENNKDIVPVSYNVAKVIYALTDEQRKDITKYAIATVKSQANKSKCKYTSVIRANAERYVSVLRSHVLNKELADDLRKELELFCTIVEDTTTGWEKIKSVTEVPTETVYDIAVPETKVFSLSNGLIVFDTINVHVPSSDEAVEEAYEKLMPSKDPFSDRMEGKIVPLPKQEQIMGLYSASISNDNRTYDFDTEEEALDAIKKGKVPTTANVNILHGIKRANVWQNQEMADNIIKRHPFKDPKTGKFMPTQKTEDNSFTLLKENEQTEKEE